MCAATPLARTRSGQIVERTRRSIMKEIIVLVILAIVAAGFFGLTVPRHVLNTLGFAAPDCSGQNC
jgi:hypothetical protein